MKRSIFLVAAIALASFGSFVSAKAADTYNIDPAHSTVGFSVQHMVISTVHGKFNEFTGTVTVDGKKIQEAKGEIQSKSIDTGVAARDKDLRSATFFDVEKYPTISFSAKKTEERSGEMVLVGDFTMHGVTKQISLPITVSGPIKDPWGKQRIGLHTKAKLNRKDYGLTYSKTLETGGLMVGDEIEIQIDAEATKAS